MRKRATGQDIFLIIVAVIGLTMLVWLPFLFHLPVFWGISLPANGLDVVRRNYDGLNYVIVAKSLYNSQLIQAFGQNLPTRYFAAHLPGYPLSIRALAPFVNYVNAMLLSSVIFTITAAIAFYLLLKELCVKTDRLWLTLLFLLLPPRWLVVHSVGSAEPLFLTAILFSMYFFIKAIANRPWQNFFFAGLFGALACMTKTPGLLLFVSYGLFLAWELYANRDALATYCKITLFPAISLLLMPLGLLFVFFWYQSVFHDLFAYFHSGDNIHLMLPPFQVFNSGQYWVGSIWLEDILFYLFAFAAATILLFRQNLKPLALFCSIFLVASVCVVHRDIARYSLPIAPFAIIAFRHYAIKTEFKIALLLLLLPIYLYTINFIAGNTFPVFDLSRYL